MAIFWKEIKMTLKRIIATFIAVSLISFSTAREIGADVSKYSIVNDDNKEVVIDDEGYYHILFDNYGIEISADDALDILNNRYNSIDLPTVYRVAPNSFRVVSQSTVNGNRYKVSPDCVGECTLTVQTSVTVTDSFSASITICGSMELAIIAKIEGSVGFNWSTSSTLTQSVGVTKTVPAGKTGALYFTPYMKVFNVIYTDENFDEWPITAKSPIELENGMPDGLFELIYK